MSFKFESLFLLIEKMSLKFESHIAINKKEKSNKFISLHPSLIYLLVR